MKKIYPCLWFDGRAEEAVKLYTSLFKNSKIGKSAKVSEEVAAVSGNKAGSTLTVEFELAGLRVLAMNGGPAVPFSPALSFFVWCDTEAEIDGYWKALSNGGKVRMGLDKYPWAPKYGWTADKFGMEWQFILNRNKQKIAPAFLYVDEMFGKGEEAIKFYLSVFKNSKIESMTKNEQTKTVMHSIFNLEGQDFALMEGEGKHGHKFNDSLSFIVNCENQAEIDYYHDALLKGGTPSQCGWLKDRFGVSWQIMPKELSNWITGPNAKRVFAEVLKMGSKIDFKTLEKTAIS